MTDRNDTFESADVVVKRPCKNVTLTKEQSIQIKIEILVAGGYEEIADRAVRNISDIIEGKVNRKIKRRGAPRLTSEQLDDTISKIRDLQRRNPHVQSDRSIYNNTKIDRRRIKRAKRIMKQRRAFRFFQIFGWKYPAPKTALNS